MGTLTRYRAFRRALTEDRLGDAAILKADLFGGGRLSERDEAALRALGIPDVDPKALRALPDGTLGREYLRLFDDNGLTPFRLSGQVPDEVVARNIFVARYSLVHDVFHVITGFDTSWAGELGVWAFVAAQRYARAHWGAVAIACVLYPCAAPLQTRRQWRNLRRGIAMGRRAERLLFVPFETMWGRSVDEVRQELSVDAAYER